MTTTRGGGGGWFGLQSGAVCTNSNGKCIHVYLCAKTLQCSCSNDSYYTPLHEMQSLLYAHFGLMATCTLQKRVPNSQEGCINITYGWVHAIPIVMCPLMSFIKGLVMVQGFSAMLLQSPPLPIGTINFINFIIFKKIEIFTKISRYFSPEISNPQFSQNF